VARGAVTNLQLDKEPSSKTIKKRTNLDGLDQSSPVTDLGKRRVESEVQPSTKLMVPYKEKKKEVCRKYTSILLEHMSEGQRSVPEREKKYF